MRSIKLKLGLLVLALCAACGDDDNGSRSRDGGARDGGPQGDDAQTADAQAGDAEVPDCYDDASTHEELMNACTDAEKVEKSPNLPLLLSDGGLPPLP